MSPLAKTWDLVMNEQMDELGYHQLCGDLCSFKRGETLCQVTRYERLSVKEQVISSSLRMVWSGQEVTTSKPL